MNLYLSGWKITIVMGIYMTGIIAVVWYAVSMDVNLVMFKNDGQRKD